jgi:inosine-uridine nucleoside N-ribohydrolase
MSSTITRVIIDTDPGVDDALAILLALSAPEIISVEALTIVHGNSADVVKLANNACTILEIAGRQDIPVYIGSAVPINNEAGRGAEFVHGHDCLGEIELPHIKHQPHPHHSAVELIVSKVRQYPKEIVLIALGPLTNIALALHVYPALAENVKEIFIMGGAANVPGNVSPVAEANVFDDPEAADIVFRAKWPKPITMASLDLTEKIRAEYSFFEPLRDSNKKSAKFVYDILKFYNGFHIKIGKADMPIHDGTAVMACLFPEFFDEKLTHISVETAGKLTRGMTVAFTRSYEQHFKSNFKILNAKLLTCKDIDKFKQRILTQILLLP